MTWGRPSDCRRWIWCRPLPGRAGPCTILDPYYWGFLAILTALQWFFPARPDQRGLSVGFGADLMWFLSFNALSVTVVAAYLAALDVAYRHLLGGWALHLPLDSAGLSILAFVVTDLLAWWTHVLHHKVPALWNFHALGTAFPRGVPERPVGQPRTPRRDRRGRHLGLRAVAAARPRHHRRSRARRS